MGGSAIRFWCFTTAAAKGSSSAARRRPSHPTGARKPTEQPGPHDWPLRGGDRVRRAVPQHVLLADHVGGLPLAEDALEAGPQPLDRGTRASVSRVGLEVHARHPPTLEGVSEEEQLRLQIHTGPLGRGREPGTADLDRVGGAAPPCAGGRSGSRSPRRPPRPRSDAVRTGIRAARAGRGRPREGRSRGRSPQVISTSNDGRRAQTVERVGYRRSATCVSERRGRLPDRGGQPHRAGTAASPLVEAPHLLTRCWTGRGSLPRQQYREPSAACAARSRPRRRRPRGGATICDAPRVSLTTRPVGEQPNRFGWTTLREVRSVQSRKGSPATTEEIEDLDPPDLRRLCWRSPRRGVSSSARGARS